jgi:hypothetical protein
MFLYGIKNLFPNKTLPKSNENPAKKKNAAASLLNSPKNDKPSKELKGMKNTPKKNITEQILLIKLIKCYLNFSLYCIV